MRNQSGQARNQLKIGALSLLLLLYYIFFTHNHQPINPSTLADYSCRFHRCCAIPLLCILLRVLPRLLIKRRPIIVKLLRRARLHRIVRHRLDQQLLRRQQHARDLGARFPRLGLQDANAHAAVLVKGDVGMPDASLEVDLGRLEGVVGGEDEEEFEFTALENMSGTGVCALMTRRKRERKRQSVNCQTHCIW